MHSHIECCSDSNSADLIQYIILYPKIDSSISPPTNLIPEPYSRFFHIEIDTITQTIGPTKKKTPNYNSILYMLLRSNYVVVSYKRSAQSWPKPRQIRPITFSDIRTPRTKLHVRLTVDGVAPWLADETNGEGVWQRGGEFMCQLGQTQP